MITRALKWVLAAVVAIPIAVLAHESGHVLAYRAFGFPEVALHYDSSTHALEDRFWALYRAGSLQAAGEIVAPWKVGAASGAGLVVTYTMVLAGCIIVARACHPLAITVVLAANLRALPVAVSMMLTWGASTIRGTDEAHVAAITGIPEVALVLLGVMSLFCSAVWMFRRVPKPERALSVASSIVGLVTGMGLYLIAGPRILP